MARRKTVIAVSAASLLFTFGPLGPLFTWILVRLFGYDGVQTLPMRGWEAPWGKLVPPNLVISINGHPWNYGTPMEVFRRVKMDYLGIPITPSNEPPKPYDFILFGRNRKGIDKRLKFLAERFPKALLVTHDFNGGDGAVEPNPEALLKWRALGGDRKSFQAELLRSKLVIDPYHLAQRGNWYGGEETVTDDFFGFLKKLDPKQIAAIHINPNGDLADFDRWLERKDCFMAKFIGYMLFKLSKRPDDLPPVPVVVETPPKYLPKLGKIQKRIRETFDAV